MECVSFKSVCAVYILGICENASMSAESHFVVFIIGCFLSMSKICISMRFDIFLLWEFDDYFTPLYDAARTHDCLVSVRQVTSSMA